MRCQVARHCQDRILVEARAPSPSPRITSGSGSPEVMPGAVSPVRIEGNAVTGSDRCCTYDLSSKAVNYVDITRRSEQAIMILGVRRTLR